MAVVPERPDLLGPEAVRVALSGEHRFCVTPATPSSRVRNVDAVPVDGHAVRDVLVHEHHLDEVALADAELGARRPPVERERVDGAA